MKIISLIILLSFAVANIGGGHLLASGDINCCICDNKPEEEVPVEYKTEGMELFLDLQHEHLAWKQKQVHTMTHQNQEYCSCFLNDPGQPPE